MHDHPNVTPITSRIRRPTDRRLYLPNGDWLHVKDHLTAGEQRNVLRGSMKRVLNLDGIEIEAVDPLQAPLAQAVAYLLDWSLVDPDGVPIPIKGLNAAELLSVLDILPPEDCEEITRVIDRHDDAMRALRAAEKKASDGGTRLPATSPSPDSLAGDTNGSQTSTPMSMVS